VVRFSVERILHDEHQPLEKFLRTAPQFATNDKKFQVSVQEEFQHKVAKAWWEIGGGSRACRGKDPTERNAAEMILAIERIIEKNK
jgi:hypothetical protein